MAQIDFTTQEIDTLLQTLEHYLPDLSMEISNTDSMDFREHLKEERHTLQSIIAKLQNALQEDGQPRQTQTPA